MGVSVVAVRVVLPAVGDGLVSVFAPVPGSRRDGLGVFLLRWLMLIMNSTRLTPWAKSDGPI